MKSGFVAIIGRPNVGKSTLLNRFIGEELAIVSPKPQTTRNKIMGIYNRADAQAVFLDTPGFHETNKALNRAMIEKVEEALKEADAVVLVTEPESTSNGIDRELFNKCKGRKVILAINKIDTVMDEPWGMVVERFWKAFDETPTVAISATEGKGCDTLLNKIIEFLPEGEPFYPKDEYTEHPMRFLAAELVREQAMLMLKQELPYVLAVEVEEYKEGAGKGGLARIRASIIVEKDSQKGIVIGAGGQMIKAIGTAAREKIEKMAGTKVFLDLHVKVVKDWTRDADAVKKYLIST